MSTKMDENVRKNQLEIKHPSWQTGIDKLTEIIASRLATRCVLYKLLVYGEGGHFIKYQDTDKEDGMIATLVVQPPSVHEGGDLVVYQNGVCITQMPSMLDMDSVKKNNNIIPVMTNNGPTIAWDNIGEGLSIGSLGQMNKPIHVLWRTIFAVKSSKAVEVLWMNVVVRPGIKSFDMVTGKIQAMKASNLDLLSKHPCDQQ
ncbi:LOW QUALITY PROTEIN: Hypothetical protein PHPALM_15347 [Phytophthora palmivora]|uniref:Uncharacterized protein n=1 Tax=Phytophthora palmivora TaxID=4796 RepID=A0A2P4XSF7_9STRA|nr:LOW QUALITY PROTEIN: Hypothetical protein PHPALM_15347 [Phytophthora palmivora]